jgi:integrase/recombinase XerD
MNAGPQTIADFVPLYLDELRAKNYSRQTIKKRAQMLSYFVTYCAERALERPADLTVAFLERYDRHLANYVSAVTGRPLAVVTRIDRLGTLRDFCRYLVARGRLLFNPALQIELPKQGRTLPRGVLSAGEVERMLLVPDITTALGLRDRAILELLYSTGVRRAEAGALNVADVDFPGGTVFIREGKGRIDRVVPIGRRALAWLAKYLETVRPALVRAEHEDGALFLGHFGRRMSKEGLAHMVSRVKTAAGITQRGAAHLLRHTAATLMLENGADVRFVQQLLGHADLGTTQRYTHVAIRALKEAHARSHPVNFAPEDETEEADV